MPNYFTLEEALDYRGLFFTITIREGKDVHPDDIISKVCPVSTLFLYLRYFGPKMQT